MCNYSNVILQFWKTRIYNIISICDNSSNNNLMKIATQKKSTGLFLKPKFLSDNTNMPDRRDRVPHGCVRGALLGLAPSTCVDEPNTTGPRVARLLGVCDRARTFPVHARRRLPAAVLYQLPVERR